MALSAAQYAQLKLGLRALLSDNTNPNPRNVSEADLFSFVNQLYVATGVALDASRLAVIDASFRAQINGAQTLPLADWQSFLSQIGVDSTGFAALPAAQYSAIELQLRALLSGLPVAPSNLSSPELKGYFDVAVPLFSASTKIIDWFEPGSLANKSPNTTTSSGDLTAPLGAVVTNANAQDGQPSWQFSKASPNPLVSASAPIFHPPIHYLVVARMNGTPAANDTVAAAKGGGLWLDYRDSTHYGIGASAFNVTAATGSFVLIKHYAHVNFSRTSINDSAYGAQQTIASAGQISQGVVLGAFNAAGLDASDCEILFYLSWEGQMTDAEATWWNNYLRTKFPTLGIAATPPAMVSLASSATGFPTGSPVAIPFAGQSNLKNNTTVATATPGANSFMLGRDSTYKALTAAYDAITNQTDFVSADTPGGAVGGLATNLINLVATRFGVNAILVSGAKGGSHLIQGAPLAANTDLDWWGRLARRGNMQRDSLYWSFVARVQDAIAKGARIPYSVWYQGESEGESATAHFATDLATTLPAFLTQLAADCGMPDKWIIVCPPPTVPTGSFPNWGPMRAAIQSCDDGVKHFVVIATDGPYEPGNLHLQDGALDNTATTVETKATAVGFN